VKRGIHSPRVRGPKKRLSPRGERGLSSKKKKRGNRAKEETRRKKKEICKVRQSRPEYLLTGGVWGDCEGKWSGRVKSGFGIFKEERYQGKKLEQDGKRGKKAQNKEASGEGGGSTCVRRKKHAGKIVFALDVNKKVEKKRGRGPPAKKQPHKGGPVQREKEGGGLHRHSPIPGSREKKGNKEGIEGTW